MPDKVFGKIPSGNRLTRIMRSPHYKNGSFQNMEPTEVTRKDASYFKLLKDFSNRPKTVRPPRELPFVQTDLTQLTATKPVITWFGHSSYIIKSKHFSILVDPVFSGHASPFSFFGKAFKGADRYTAEDFPDIDLLIITHDHYDHLDYATITKLAGRIKQVVTPLGVGAHLEYWGIDAGKITELDWWESKTVEAEISVRATPARHFSGRKFVRNKTLWASFVLTLHKHKIFIGGDSGYDAQFGNVGRTYGPFDLVILECGQYGDDWPYIHMKPEETAQAAVDLKAAIIMPVHWGKFVLSVHPWNEPVKRITAAAEKLLLPVVTPLIGEPYTIGDQPSVNKWWDF